MLLFKWDINSGTGNEYFRRQIMMDWGFGNWGWGMGLMMFIGLVFWGCVIALIVWAVTRVTRRESHSGGGKQNPLDIARERYAKGEITKEQYEQFKKDLS
jgi:putative membrane protein